ncbi:NADH-quinone oxidoreductase subunit H [Candidatus Methanomassiliicoccus intestinalis]|uniref:NADH-quinone oxidoreductase subunit H n=1 Tax=Candidatus Methanomassiliicoccus intestinalis TaxID=1406512 RepID=UPI0037DBFC8D
MNALLALFETIVVILLGGFSLGLARKLSAKMQRRIGPSVFQAFYDVAKLFAKEPFYTSKLPVAFAVSSLAFQIAAVFIVIDGGDTMMAFFVSGAGAVYLAAGAFASPSVYSWLGARRELLAIAAYEPVLFVLALSVSTHAHNLLLVFPAAFLAAIPVLSVLLERSPYDVPGAHQEIVSGPYADYAGRLLGILNLAKWAQLGFVYVLLAMLVWSENIFLDIVAKIVLVAVAIFATIWIDNATARVSRRTMMLTLPSITLGLMAINIAIMHLAGVI